MKEILRIKRDININQTVNNNQTKVTPSLAEESHLEQPD
jgi:hypothetical protein